MQPRANSLSTVHRSIRTPLRHGTRVGCAVVLSIICARGADQLLSFPLVFSRGDGMGGTGMSYGGTEEAVYRNPAWAGSFRRLCITFPGVSLNIDNNYFRLMSYLAEHREEFEQDSAEGSGSDSDPDAFFRDSLMREFDGKWFGLNSNFVDFSLLVRGFGVLFRSRFSSDFAANRGLLFPFMLAEYGQEREITVVYGRKFANDHLQLGAGVKLLRQQRAMKSVASNNIGEIEKGEYWSLSEDDWKNGIGLDLGGVGNIPGRRHLAASLRNIGLKTREQSMPDVSFGYGREIRQALRDEYSFVGDITAALECVNLAGPGPWPAKLKMGGEIAFNLLPKDWLALHLRSGLNGGYLTFGIGVRAVKFVTVDYVTYAEEVGSYIGQEARRRHLLYCRAQFDFNRVGRAKVLKDEGAEGDAAPAAGESDGKAQQQLPARQQVPPPPPTAPTPAVPQAPLPSDEPVPETQPQDESTLDEQSAPEMEQESAPEADELPVPPKSGQPQESPERE